MWKSSIIVFITYVLFIPITLAMGDARSEDQWVSVRVLNRMRKNDISFKNAALSWWVLLPKALLVYRASY